MGSVSSTNPGVANLLQLLSNVNSPIASSPSAAAALEKASPTDIAQLSVAALQLQGMDEMFGITNGSENPASSLANLLVAPEEAAAAAEVSPTTIGTTATPTTSTATTAAEQLANSQLSEVEGLYGTGTTGSTSNSLLNLIG